MTANDRVAWTEVDGQSVVLAEGSALDINALAFIAAMRLNVPWWRISEWHDDHWVETDEPPCRNPNYRSILAPSASSRH